MVLALVLNFEAKLPSEMKRVGVGGACLKSYRELVFSDIEECPFMKVKGYHVVRKTIS